MMIASLLTEQPLVHQLLVHFLLALFLIAPVFILLAIFWPPPLGGDFLFIALLLMSVGTIVSYCAIETGAAARSQRELTPQLWEVLQRHRSLAETTTLIFSALTAVFAGIVLIPRFISRQPSRVLRTALPAVFLVLYATGLIVLAQTADMGRRVALEFGPRTSETSNPRHSRDPQGMSENSDLSRNPVQTLGQR